VIMWIIFLSTRSILELRDLLVEMRRVLSKVNVPALLVHSRQDGNVPTHNASVSMTAWQR